MVNIFIGDKTKRIGCRVSEEAQNAIKEHYLKHGFVNITDYILTLIDKDMRG